MLHRLLCIVLLASGCSYNLNRQPPDDAGKPDAPLDSSPVDQRTDDGRAAEGLPDMPWPPDSRPLTDSKPLPDSPWPNDIGPPQPDTTICRGSCCQPPGVNPNAASCSQQCITPTGDPDCDGLAGATDPMATCNELLFVDEFRVDPSTSPTWTATNTDWTCGQATLKAGGNITLNSPLPGGSNSYMVAARISFGPALDPATWSVSIRTGLDTGVEYVCQLWVSSQYGVTSPTLHHNRKNACGDNGILSAGSGKIANPPQGTYILQLYHLANKSVCRILDGTNTVVYTSSGYTGCPGPTPDRFRVYTNNINVYLHHVRAYRME